MNEVARCNSTRDCAAIDEAAPRFCFEDPIFSEEPFICDCALLYGWTGKDCDETSPFLWFQRAIYTVLLLFALFIIVAISRTIILNYIYEGLNFSSLSVTAYAVLLSALSFFLYFALSLQTFVNPRIFKFYDQESILLGIEFESMDSKYLFVQVFFQGFGSLLFSVASIFLILSWQEIFLKVAVNKSYFNGERAKRQRRSMKIIVSILIIIVSILLLLNDVYEAIIISILLSLIVAIFYGCISQRFIVSLSDIMTSFGDEKGLQAIVRFVRRIRIYLIALITLLLLGTVVLSATLLDAPEKAAPGDFYVAHVGISFVSGITLVQLVIIAWYVNSVSVGPIVSEEYFPLGTRIFRLWDNMNSKIIPDEAGVDGDSPGSTMFVSYEETHMK